MHLFSDYLHPLTIWLQSHPYFALFFTFLISFAESLAIIGSIIPGSVTMTAVGFLAGSRVMRVDLTLIVATLGAIAGDSLSYTIGYRFHYLIPKIWPFRNNPEWLVYGKDYFARHGGKSVLIGRFFGPLRSIIPVIAGMMRMNQTQFLIANVISGIAWALVYVLPGTFIGAASVELSPETATRLLFLLLSLLATLWLFGLILRYLSTKLNATLTKWFHVLWLWSTKKLSPKFLKYYQLTLAFLSLLLFLIIFLGVSADLYMNQIEVITYFPLSSFKFFQNFKSYLINMGVNVRYILQLLSLCLFIGFVLIHFITKKNGALFWWINLYVTYGIFYFITSKLISNIFPNFYLILSLITAQLSFLLLYAHMYLYPFNKIIDFLIFSWLLVSWFIFTSINHSLSYCILGYTLGIILGLSHWILYQRITNIIQNDR